MSFILPGQLNPESERTAIERALDAGKLFLHMQNGNWWQARRNGATKTWKRDRTRWEIPVKMGFRGHATLRPNQTGWRILN